MGTGGRLGGVIMVLGLTALAAGPSAPATSPAPSPVTNAASGPTTAESAPAFVERPRILDDAGKVVSEFTFPAGQTERVVKLTQVRDVWVTRDVKINGREVGWMVIDTGANLTTLDKMAAEGPGFRALTLGQGEDYAYLRGVDQIELDGISLQNHVVGVGDFASLRTNMGFPLKGSLGGDFLGQTPFCLDFTAGTLTFYARRSFKPPAGAREMSIQLSGKGQSGSVLRGRIPRRAVPWWRAGSAA